MNRNTQFLTLVAMALACGQVSAQAQPARPPAQAPAPAGASQQADATFAAWDADRNQNISQQEFRNGWANMQRRILAEGLRNQFNRVDANKNGAIDANEYGQLVLVQRAGNSAPALATFDANKDQRLQFQEYAAMVQRLTPRK